MKPFSSRTRCRMFQMVLPWSRWYCMPLKFSPLQPKKKPSLALKPPFLPPSCFQSLSLSSGSMYYSLLKIIYKNFKQLTDASLSIKYWSCLGFLCCYSLALIQYNQVYIIMNVLPQQGTGLKTAQNKTKILPKSQRYKLGREIGAGTFGKVYEATDLQTGERVAVKEAFQDSKYKNRELDISENLKHENVIDVKDFYYVERNKKKYLYLVMEVYDTNLQLLFRKHRNEKRHIDRMDIKILAFQLFKGLYYLQQQKVCHRDIKPSNVLIKEKTLELRICDFGSAKFFKDVEKNVCYICSRYYRPPELLFKYDMYGLEIDMWSAGCILVEFLTKEPLFPGDSSIEQLIEIMKVIGTPPRHYIDAYTDEFDCQLNLPNVQPTGWERLLKVYKPEPLMVDLISKILVFDIKSRLTPYQVLRHPYFHDLVEPQYQKKVQRLPQLLSFTSSLNATNLKQVLHLSQLYQTQGELLPALSLEKGKVWEQKEETGDSTPMPSIDLFPPPEDSKSKSQVIETSETLPAKSAVNVPENQA